ncbi:hypothetical protein ACQ4PT_048367 [Festuca glaucescens]
MEVVAPRDVTPAPFALCPRFQLLAVGMASSPASAETVASRIDILRLLRPSGEHGLGREMQVDCFVRAPGLRRVAWSSSPTMPDDSPLVPVEQVTYPAGLLAGGFDDGSVRIWSPDPALLCDLTKISVAEKPKAVQMLNHYPNLPKMDEAEISTGTCTMYSDIQKLTWTCSEEEELSETEDEDEDEEGMSNWQIIDDAERFGWDLISKEESVVKCPVTKTMPILMETRDLTGPVLGLSFNDLNPYWLATAAKSERIIIHDLQYPFHLSKRKREFGQVASSNVNSQTTCLKWSKISPTILASSGDAGITRIWDIRRAPWQTFTTFTPQDKVCSSDIEFSWNNPMHLAVSTEASATVKVWDMRKFTLPSHEYASGDSGVVSMSWSRSGQLLTSHTNGGLSCYDVYKEKMVQDMDLPHCDLGCTWTHVENVAALLSSKTGVKLYEIGG